LSRLPFCAVVLPEQWKVRCCWCSQRGGEGALHQRACRIHEDWSLTTTLHHCQQPHAAHMAEEQSIACYGVQLLCAQRGDLFRPSTASSAVNEAPPASAVRRTDTQARREADSQTKGSRTEHSAPHGPQTQPNSSLLLGEPSRTGAKTKQNKTNQKGKEAPGRAQGHTETWCGQLDEEPCADDRLRWAPPSLLRSADHCPCPCPFSLLGRTLFGCAWRWLQWLNSTCFLLLSTRRSASLRTPFAVAPFSRGLFLSLLV
jgi:hypothetical protein